MGIYSGPRRGRSVGRIGMWRGGQLSSSSVAASFPVLQEQSEPHLVTPDVVEPISAGDPRAASPNVVEPISAGDPRAASPNVEDDFFETRELRTDPESGAEDESSVSFVIVIFVFA